jgi:hypothetical protein
VEFRGFLVHLSTLSESCYPDEPELEDEKAEWLGDHGAGSGSLPEG